MPRRVWDIVSRHKTKAAAAAKRKLLSGKRKGATLRVVTLKTGVYRYLVKASGYRPVKAPKRHIQAVQTMRNRRRVTYR